MLPSRTAAGVARARAQLTRPATAEGDPDGEARLEADLTVGVAGTDPPAPTPLFHHIAARTRFFDDATVAALDGGTTQIVDPNEIDPEAPAGGALLITAVTSRVGS